VFRIPSDDSSDSNIIARLSAWTDPVYPISSQSYLVPRQDLQHYSIVPVHTVCITFHVLSLYWGQESTRTP
jgi:hypothetical protein